MTTFTNCNNWNLLPVATNVRGVRSAAITCENSAPVKLLLGPTHAPFGAGSFQPEEKIRLNLDLTCTEVYTKMLSVIDAWVIGRLAADPMGYFKKPMSLAEIKSIYKASSTPHSKNGVEYSDTMRTKLNMEGPKVVKCWTPEKVSRALPLDWRGCTLKPIVLVRGVWFMSGQCGITFETQHCTVEEEDLECPF